MQTAPTALLRPSPVLPCKPLTAVGSTRYFGTDITNQSSAMDVEDPKSPNLYAKEILEVLLASETQTSASHGYMKRQPDINDRMRGILVDWLVEVHLKFRLHADTLFLTINIVDRVLERTAVYRQQLQLVGVAALFVAAKYEEIHPPELKDLVYITDSAFLREDILDMETRILRLLEYRVTAPGPQRFLERFQSGAQVKPSTLHLSYYFLELALLDYKMLRYRASVTAAAALYLSRKIHQSQDRWQNAHFSENELKACAKDLCSLAQNAEKGNLQAVRKKFALERFSEVATVTNFRLTPTKY